MTDTTPTSALSDEQIDACIMKALTGLRFPDEAYKALTYGSGPYQITTPKHWATTFARALLAAAPPTAPVCVMEFINCDIDAVLGDGGPTIESAPTPTSALSDERILDLAGFYDEEHQHVFASAGAAQVIAFARAILAAAPTPAQEPVAWRAPNLSYSCDLWAYRDADDRFEDTQGNLVGEPLYAAPQPAPTPTSAISDEQIHQEFSAWIEQPARAGRSMADAFKAGVLLAAAPQPAPDLQEERIREVWRQETGVEEQDVPWDVIGFANRIYMRDAAPTPAQEPVAWLHEVWQPGGHHGRLLSNSSKNPWSHWVERHLSECTYKATPLYAAPQPAQDAQGLKDALALLYPLRERIASGVNRDRMDEVIRLVESGIKTKEGV